MKVMLDSAVNDPVYIRRGDDIYQLSHYGQVGVVANKETRSNYQREQYKKAHEKIAGAAPKITPITGPGMKNVGYNEKGHIVPMSPSEQAVYKADFTIDYKDIIAKTPSDILKEIDALKATLEAEKAENELNQDPDYWADFNVRYKKLDELWAEYHRLKGTK